MNSSNELTWRKTGVVWVSQDDRSRFEIRRNHGPERGFNLYDNVANKGYCGSSVSECKSLAAELHGEAA